MITMITMRSLEEIQNKQCRVIAPPRLGLEDAWDVNNSGENSVFFRLSFSLRFSQGMIRTLLFTGFLANTDNV